MAQETVVKPFQTLADGSIGFRQTVESTVAQYRQYPSLSDQYARFNLCLISVILNSG
jgi:hypothetical protein